MGGGSGAGRDDGLEGVVGGVEGGVVAGSVCTCVDCAGRSVSRGRDCRPTVGGDRSRPSKQASKGVFAWGRVVESKFNAN